MLPEYEADRLLRLLEIVGRIKWELSQTPKHIRTSEAPTVQWDHLFLQEETEKKRKSQDQASKLSKTPAICYEEVLKPLWDFLFLF